MNGATRGRFGGSWHGTARSGKARQGRRGSGSDWQGSVRFGLAGVVWLGGAWHGTAGQAGLGVTRHGLSGRGVAGMAGSVTARCGQVRQARHCVSRLVPAWCGPAGVA